MSVVTVLRHRSMLHQLSCVEPHLDFSRWPLRRSYSYSFRVRHVRSQHSRFAHCIASCIALHAWRCYGCARSCGAAPVGRIFLLSSCRLPAIWWSPQSAGHLPLSGCRFYLARSLCSLLCVYVLLRFICLQFIRSCGATLHD